MKELHLLSLQDAEALSEACAALSREPLLRAGRYCVSAASALGALTLIYGEARPILLDTEGLPVDESRRLLRELREKGLLTDN